MNLVSITFFSSVLACNLHLESELATLQDILIILVLVPGGEERAEMNSDIARESMYRFPSEDELEDTMQVTKEVEE